MLKKFTWRDLWSLSESACISCHPFLDTSKVLKYVLNYIAQGFFSLVELPWCSSWCSFKLLDRKQALEKKAKTSVIFIILQNLTINCEQLHCIFGFYQSHFSNSYYLHTSLLRWGPNTVQLLLVLENCAPFDVRTINPHAKVNWKTRMDLNFVSNNKLCINGVWFCDSRWWVDRKSKCQTPTSFQGLSSSRSPERNNDLETRIAVIVNS